MNNNILKAPSMASMKKEGFKYEGSATTKNIMKCIEKHPPWCSWFISPCRINGTVEIWIKE